MTWWPSASKTLIASALSFSAGRRQSCGLARLASMTCVKIDATSVPQMNARCAGLRTYVAILHPPKLRHDREVDGAVAIHGHVRPQLPHTRRPTLRGLEVRVPLNADHTGEKLVQGGMDAVLHSTRHSPIFHWAMRWHGAHGCLSRTGLRAPRCEQKRPRHG